MDIVEMEPLELALKSNDYEKVKILMEADTDFCITDRAIGILMFKMQSDTFSNSQKKKIEEIIPHIVDTLKRRNLDAEKLVELLVKTDWSLRYIWLFNDVQIARKFLENTSLKNNDDFMDIKYIMDQCDLEKVELVVRYGGNSRRMNFYQYLSWLYREGKRDLWRVFIERLLDWDAVNKVALPKLDSIFNQVQIDDLEFLLKSKILVEVKERFGIDFRVSIFGNWRIDTIELLAKKDFDVNARGIRQQTALHFAVKNGLLENAKLLLDSGIDVNAKNEWGRTALFNCVELQNGVEIGQLLVEYGADVQIIDNNGLSIFGFALSRKKFSLLGRILAQLAIVRAKGLPIKPHITARITCCTGGYENIYEICYRQIEALKTYEIGKSISLFDILTNKIENFYQLLPNQNCVLLLDEYQQQHRLHSFYYSTLHKKLSKAWKFYCLKCDVADIICESPRQFLRFDHLILRMIFEYLTEKDMMNLKEVVSEYDKTT